jgi:hypothetical protein
MEMMCHDNALAEQTIALRARLAIVKAISSRVRVCPMNTVAAS